MGSIERSKKKTQLWKKAMVHFCLCFVLGFFTGVAPTVKTKLFSNHVTVSHHSDLSLQPMMKTETLSPSPSLPAAPMRTRSDHDDETNVSEQEVISPKRLVIIVTPTSVKDKLRVMQLTKMANTLRLVSPPLLWIVVEQERDEGRGEVSELLRETGIMNRHLVFKENFTHLNDEMDHQRNVALNHIEHHKLSGIVHFAGLDNVYDLSFFEEIRGIEVFGTWPMALLSANRKRVKVEGPVCDSSEVIGWHLKKLQNLTDSKPPIHISSFAFNSSILWDPERWGRTSSLQDTSQDSLKFVRNEVLQEETKLKGIPANSCSKIMLWNLHISKGISSHQAQR